LSEAQPSYTGIRSLVKKPTIRFRTNPRANGITPPKRCEEVYGVNFLTIAIVSLF